MKTNELKFAASSLRIHYAEIDKEEFKRMTKGIEEDDIESFYQFVDDSFLIRGCEYALPDGYAELRYNNKKVRNFNIKFQEIYKRELEKLNKNQEREILGANAYSFLGIESYADTSYALNIEEEFNINKFSIEFHDINIGNTENGSLIFIPTYDGIAFEYEDGGEYDSDYMVYDKKGKMHWVEFD